jgi:hypothetical protein
VKYGHIIDAHQRFIYQAYEGRCTLNYVIACTRRLWADPDYQKSYHGVADLSRMTVDQNIDDLHGYIRFLKSESLTSNVRWAVIAASPWLTAGAMLYRASMGSRHPIEIFSTWRSAMAYLQLDLPSPPAIVYFSDITPAPNPSVT